MKERRKEIAERSNLCKKNTKATRRTETKKNLAVENKQIERKRKLT